MSMSPDEFNKILSEMDKTIRKAKEAAKAMPLLIEKVSAQQEIKRMEAERDEYALTFYEVTA